MITDNGFIDFGQYCLVKNSTESNFRRSEVFSKFYTFERNQSYNFMKKILFIALLLSSSVALSQNTQTEAQESQADFKEIYGEFEKNSPDAVYIHSLDPDGGQTEIELENFYDPSAVEFKRTGVLIREIGNEKIVRFYPYESIRYVRTVNRVMHIVL